VGLEIRLAAAVRLALQAHPVRMSLADKAAGPADKAAGPAARMAGPATPVQAGLTQQAPRPTATALATLAQLAKRSGPSGSTSAR